MIMQIRLESARGKAERLEQERKDRHEMRNEIQALVMPLEIKLQQLEVAVARLDGHAAREAWRLTRAPAAE
jgi:hypothetical protein